MAKVENLDKLNELRKIYRDLCKTQDGEILGVNIQMLSGTVSLPEEMYDDIVLLCSKKIDEIIEEIEKL